MWKSAKFPFVSMFFWVVDILKTIRKLLENMLTDCGKVFFNEIFSDFLVFKVINMTFQHILCVEKSKFKVEH